MDGQLYLSHDVVKFCGQDEKDFALLAAKIFLTFRVRASIQAKRHQTSYKTNIRPAQKECTGQKSRLRPEGGERFEFENNTFEICTSLHLEFCSFTIFLRLS